MLQNEIESKPASRLLDISLAIAFGLAAVLLFELSFRALTDIGIWRVAPIEHDSKNTSPDLFEYDKVLGWKGKANIRLSLKEKGHSIFVRHNSHGLREREIPFERKAGRLRILILGDSQTWGSGVAQGERFTEVFQGLLERAGVDSEVLNFGVVGYGTDQEFLLFRRLGVRYRPDLVIVAFYWNDNFENSLSIAYGSPKPFYIRNKSGSLELRNVPVPRNDKKNESLRFVEVKGRPAPPAKKVWKGTKTWLEINSYSYQLLTAVARREPFYRFAVETGLAEGPRRDPESEEWKTTAGLLKRLKDAAEKAGSKFAIAILPERSDFETSAHFFRQPLIDEIKRLSGTDLYPALRAVGPAEKFYFHRDIHLNSEGHRAVGRALFDYLMQERGIRI